MVTKADVIVIAPELSGVDDATFNVFIADAMLFVDAAGWKSRYDWALKYEVAFRMTSMGYGDVAGSSGSSGGANLGPISGMSVGGVSVSYATASGGSGGGGGTSSYPGYESNKYGRAIIGARRQFGMHIAVVV